MSVHLRLGQMLPQNRTPVRLKILNRMFRSLESGRQIQMFNLSAGDREVVPVLQEILEINPRVKIIASPWSAPPWMKTTDSLIKGALRPEHYASFARYLVRNMGVSGGRSCRFVSKEFADLRQDLDHDLELDVLAFLELLEVDARLHGYVLSVGVVTAIPLLLFAYGAQRIRLVTVGLLQYIAPTVQLIIGLWIYHEPFARSRAAGFIFIWAGLALYTADNLIAQRRVLTG